ncbi:MAG: AAA family ATPase [Planctomycetes bacterium]|nr:AAA family ATPase [Planctomycetota bacterium]
MRESTKGGVPMPSKNKSISSICVKGYKSLSAEQSVEIRPLTILAGANSSGKSSIMQPLLLLKQTLDATSDPGALLLDGPNISFTLAEQMLSRIPGKPGSPRFSVGIQMNSLKLALTFSKKAQHGFDIEAMEYTEREKSYVIKYGMSEDEILPILPDPYKSLKNGFIVPGEGKMRWVVRRERCFLSFAITVPKAPSPEYTYGVFDVSPSHQFVKAIRDTIHLPALRGNPARTYKKVSTGPNFPGTFEAYAASIVACWQLEKDPRLDKLGRALEAMGLTWKVAARQVDDTQVELKVGRLVHPLQGGAHDLVNIADVGFGVSQSLPVIVALLCAQPGQLVYLEQPELHLHPKAQRRLAKILNGAVGRGVVVVVETHSDLLLREVQTLVAKGELDKKSVILHWFTRDKDTGSTTVSSAELNEKGAYGAWPEDFDVTKLASVKEYLDAVEDQGKV